MRTSLEQEFNDEVLSLFTRTGEATGYWPRYFLRKARNVGGYKLAQDLLDPTTKAATGFGRLTETGRLDLSIEYLALQPRWASLFTPAQREVARKRLEEVGYSTPPDAGNDDRIVYLNNCKNRDHVGIFGEGAFYDLNTTGIQATQATGLRPGQECVVATTAPGNRITFGWYSFLREAVMPDERGVPCRAFFGTLITSETQSKAAAARDPLYAPFFNVNGHFKQQSVIRAGNPASLVYPDEFAAEQLDEGAARSVTVNAYERNTVARARCIAHYKPVCVVCGTDFAVSYGPLAAGLIHIHHLKPLSEIGRRYTVDPIKDLRPVCPNCHAVLHWGGTTRSIEEVREMIGGARA